MTMESAYAPGPATLPDPPKDAGNYLDLLRWCVAVSDPESTDLRWAIRLLAARAEGPLTQRQMDVAGRVVSRTYDRWRKGTLHYQNPPTKADIAKRHVVSLDEWKRGA